MDLKIALSFVNFGNLDKLLSISETDLWGKNGENTQLEMCVVEAGKECVGPQAPQILNSLLRLLLDLAVLWFLA